MKYWGEAFSNELYYQFKGFVRYVAWIPSKDAGEGMMRQMVYKWSRAILSIVNNSQIRITSIP